MAERVPLGNLQNNQQTRNIGGTRISITNWYERCAFQKNKQTVEYAALI